MESYNEYKQDSTQQPLKSQISVAAVLPLTAAPRDVTTLLGNTTNLTTGAGGGNVTLCTNDYCVSDDDYVDMMLQYINPTASECFLIAIYSIIFIIGLVGNFLVCYAVLSNQNMRTVTNFFIVNLAVADFLVILICLPPTLLVDITETWYMGSVGCKLVQYLQGVSVSVSVLTLSFISVERWYAICHPLKFRATLTRARALMAFVWILSGVIYIPELFVLDAHAPHPELTVLFTVCKPTWSNTAQSIYQLVLIVMLYFLPFILMGVCYIQIARNLWSNIVPTAETCSREPLRLANGQPSSAAAQQLASRKKASKMLIAVVIMFGVCYLPVHMLNILRYTGLLQNLDPNSVIIFALISHCMAYFNSAVNPVIYNFMSEKFRAAFGRVLQCSCTRFRQEFHRVCCGCCAPRRRYGTHSRALSYRYSQTENISLQTCTAPKDQRICVRT